MSQKHLIVIHGRATKPSEREKKRLVKRSLLHGLERVSEDAAQKIRSGDVKFSFAFYGDISNHLMIEAGKKSRRDLPDRDSAHDDTPCEKAGSYDTDLERLFARTQFTKSAYKTLLKQEDDLRAVDNVASAVSGVLNLLGLSDNVIRAATPDMGAYLTTRRTGSAVRTRLQRRLEKPMRDGADICLVSHSMGCIVSYDVLWKYSRMSEYSHLHDKKITRWITLGCPLGEGGVRDNLYDADEPDDGRYPTNIRRWVNFAAQDDFVSHDGTMKNDFRRMRRQRLVESIRDESIYNFWAGSSGSNPHKFYGYLDHPKVAQEIASWIG